jgi:hypothetical protein
MTPKQKAQELFDNMCQTISSGCEHDSYCEMSECKWKGIVYCHTAQNEAKQCALIAAKEVADNCGNFKFKTYWTVVIAEIEQL